MPDTVLYGSSEGALSLLECVLTVNLNSYKNVSIHDAKGKTTKRNGLSFSLVQYAFCDIAQVII